MGNQKGIMKVWNEFTEGLLFKVANGRIVIFFSLILGVATCNIPLQEVFP